MGQGLRPMGPRNPADAHRAATPLELLYDLVSVIAIASAAAGLHHALVEVHIVEGLLRYFASFFAIWWAWMNFTWFASAYDNDDALYRVLTMIIMSGALVMAAGIGPFFVSTELDMIVIGYVIMRVGMIALWLRAAAHDQQRRRTAQYYAIGIGLAQVYWIGLCVLGADLPLGWFFPLFAVGALLEMAVPAVAERKMATPWHRHHIMERYGLLNIIVLGETLLAGSMALAEVAGAHFSVALVEVAVSSVVILFAMWWLYFAEGSHLRNDSLSVALTWGYGHIVIFASGGAVGAGFAAMVDVSSGHGHLSLLASEYSVAVPVAIYMLGLWFVRDRCECSGTMRWVLPAFAAITLVSPLLAGVKAVAIVSALCVVVRSRGYRHAALASES